MRRILFALVLIVSCVLSGVAWFQPAATKSKPVSELLPADSFVYLSWDGMDQHKEGFQKTAAAKALVDSGFIEVTIEALRGVLAQAGQETSQVVEQVGEQFFDRGFSFGMALHQVEGMPPLPYGVAVLNGGADLEPGVARLFQQLLGRQAEISV